MGMIHARKRGNYWEYSFETASVKRQRKRICKSGFRTKADALAAGTKAQSEYNDAGLYFTPSEISFNDYLDFWMENYCMLNLKDTTIYHYRKRIDSYIRPELGMYKLKALTPLVLQQFINGKAKQRYSRNTLDTLKGILSGSLRYAVKHEMIRYSPMANVTLPSKRNERFKLRTSPHVYIPAHWISKIFERFPEGSSVHIPMMIAYKGGLRLGETFGCSWDDVDFKNNTLRVARQVQWDDTNKTWYISLPKYESVRVIDMDQDFMDLLRREKVRQKKSEVNYDEYYTRHYINEDNQLNTNGDGKEIRLIAVRENGTFVNPRCMQHTSGVIHHELGYEDFDFHSFRHTHASMLAENDVPAKYLQLRLGHQNLEVTMRYYWHLTERMQEKGSDILQKMFVSNDKESED